MSDRFDVIVIGVGAMGSAACYHLARRGVKVLGLEQFSIGHALGSSHGTTRLIRKAYFESESYVPLLHRAYDLWDALSAEAGLSLLHRVGLLIMGPGEGGMAIGGVQETAARHKIPIEILSCEECRSRFPQFSPATGYLGIYEPGAGYLLVEKCVEAYARLARERGATILTGETVKQWRAEGDGIRVATDRGSYSAARLVLTAGPWSGALLDTLKLPITIRRVTQFWFPSDESYAPSRGMPCFAFDEPGHFIYGFPRLPEVGVKIASHAPAEVVTDIGKLDRKTHERDLFGVRDCIRRSLPGVSPVPCASSVCLYTMTPDEHFIIDTHPRHPQVVFAAGFSGHGFKFASVVGEILCELSLDGQTRQPIGFLRRRWAV